MAAPDIVFKFNSGSEGSPTWTDILAGEIITFTGAGSSAGDLKAIPVPEGGNLIHIADECWIDKGTDTEVANYKDGSEGQDHTSYSTDFFTVNPSDTNIFAIQADTNPEAQAGELEAWDDTSYNTTAKEILNGTAGLGVHSQLRACETASNVTPATAGGTIPGGYLTQGGQTATYQLLGSTESLTFSSSLTAGNQNRFIMHLFVLDDSAAGSETVELTYKYYYT